MAIQKGTSVYGVVETNHVAAVKTGQNYSQYELDATDFANIPAENGMLLTVNHVAGTVGLPKSVADNVYLHASVEKSYDGKGRKYFAVNRGEFLPRLVRLESDDIFETNAFQYDDTKYANVAAIAAAIDDTTVYGVPSTAGYIQIVEDVEESDATVVLKATRVAPLPNGEDGIRFVVQ